MINAYINQARILMNNIKNRDKITDMKMSINGNIKFNRLIDKIISSKMNISERI